LRNDSFLDFGKTVAMSGVPGRLLRLLSLLQARTEWTGAELAARLEVTPRTVRNDVARLRELGYPVDATPGATGGYRLGVGATMPPLLLDDDEVVAVAVGLRTVACTSLAGIEETSLRALNKLEQILPSRLRGRVTALQSEVEPLHWGTPHTVVDPTALAVLSQACRDREQVRFDYEDRQGSSTRRLVEPYRLVPDGHRWYLLAWDVRRSDWRTFRIDRASRPRLAGVRFHRRDLPAADAATFVRESITGRQLSYEAEVVLWAPAAVAAERIPRGVGTIEAVDERRCRFRTSVDSLEWLACRLATLGWDFDVESPPELLEQLRSAARRITRATRLSDAG
jgi:predicted DNA-binding transcriptional regulator YafY